MGFIIRFRSSLASLLSSRRATVARNTTGLVRASRLGRRRWHAPVPVLALLALIVPATLAACGGTTAGGGSDTLVFGAPVSLTGSLSHEGTDTLNGYNLWADQVNAKGGIKVGDKTYKVKIKYYDDGSSAQKSAQLTKQLITSDKVNFMLGPYGSAATLTDEVIAQQYQMPMVEGNGAAQAIFAKNSPYIFGVLSPSPEYAGAMIKAALSVANPPKTIAIINANDSFSTEVATAAKSLAQSSGMDVVYTQSYPANATDLSGVLTQIKTSANGGVPDMILGSGHEGEALTTMKQAKQLGINPKVWAFTVGPALPDFATTLSGDANYVIGSSQWTPQEKYQGQDIFGTAPNFEQVYKAKYSVEPSHDSDGRVSAAGLFTFSPRFTGADQSSCALARLAIQMSCRPMPPGRVLKKYSARASRSM